MFNTLFRDLHFCDVHIGALIYRIGIKRKIMRVERDLDSLIQEKYIGRCELCHNRMDYVGSGKYRCSYCGMEVLDDFGKLKQFLDQHGPTPSAIISQKTGISMDKIDAYLKKGMVEIKDGEKYYLSCEKCGCAIRYGRFCPECARSEVVNKMKASYEDVGERPKNYNPNTAGKMRFLNRKD